MTNVRVLLNHPPLSDILFDLVPPEIELIVASDQEPATLIDEGAGAAALVVRGPGAVPRHVLERLEDVRCILAFGSGTDTVDLTSATDLGIPVVNNAGAAPTPVAEYVIASTLHLFKRLGEAEAWLRRGDSWSRRIQGLRGREAAGRTMGIIGLGHIGREVARRARLGLDMQIAAYDPVVDSDVFDEHRVQRLPLEQLLETSDVVSVHVPLVDATRGLLNATAFRRMRSDAVLVNTSRGGVIDEVALQRALLRGELGGAALDVFCHEPPRTEQNPLFEIPHLLLTPHIAGITEEASERLSRSTADNLLETLRGRRPATLVNPEVGWPPERADRLGWPLSPASGT